MRKIIVDGVALALYAVVSLPTLTGVTAHEWLGLAVLVVLFVHGVQHYDFVAAVLRPARSSGSSRNAAAAEVANADGATGARAVGVAEAAGDRGAQSADDRTLRFARPRRAGAWARLVLDATLLLALVVVVLSGLMESGAILPALGWDAEGYFFWAPLHAAAAKVLLALIVVHLALDGAAAWRLIARARATSPERDGGAPDECEAA